MTKEGRKHSKLFYWVGVPVLSIIGLLILGFLALFLYYFFAGTNYTYIHSNEIPMYGFTSYEQYKNGRTDAIAKVDDDFVNEVLSLSNGDKRNASNHACNRGFEYFNNNFFYSFYYLYLYYSFVYVILKHKLVIILFYASKCNLIIVVMFLNIFVCENS